jgi:dipeptidyl aminopeptidase/acylaminoacyl peptidase
MTVQTKKREVGNLILENIPDIPTKLHHRLHLYHDIRPTFFADWCQAESGMLISTRFGEVAQIYRIAGPGEACEQLTFSEEPITIAASCPHPTEQGFLFAKDTGGNERYQLFYYDPKTDTSRLLTDQVSKTGSGIWNPAGTAIVYTSSKRNQVDQDIYLYDFAGGSGEQLLLETEGYWYPESWDHRGQYVSLINYRSINESHLYLLNVETGDLQAICVEPEVACQGGVWSLDGRTFYFASDLQHDYKVLMSYDLETRQMETMLGQLKLETEDIALSADGRYLAVVLNDNGVSRLCLYDLEEAQHRFLPAVPEGVITNLRWHPRRLQLAMTVNQAQAPADVLVFDVEEWVLQQWTVGEATGLQRATFVRPRLIKYPTFDYEGAAIREIPAFYFRPEREAESPMPVLIYIHGGPESQFRPVFSPSFQYYTNELGIAVIAPNVRGSTGYGKHYLKLDNGYKREHAVQDVGKLLDWIDQQPELDGKRVAVMGGSYGGYMVLASMAHFNERLCCGIDIFGISNFVTFLQNTKSYRRALRRVEYGDERDPKMRRHLERISPTTNAHKITKPMMIVQGLNDPRVPVSEAEQMVNAIRQNGGEAWYLLAKDEGHGFRKKSNRDFYDQATILFLKRYLLEEATVLV